MRPAPSLINKENKSYKKSDDVHERLYQSSKNKKDVLMHCSVLQIQKK